MMHFIGPIIGFLFCYFVLQLGFGASAIGALCGVIIGLLLFKD